MTHHRSYLIARELVCIEHCVFSTDDVIQVRNINIIFDEGLSL